jgi:hypothetical protein
MRTKVLVIKGAWVLILFLAFLSCPLQPPAGYFDANAALKAASTVSTQGVKAPAVRGRAYSTHVA